MPEYLAPGVFVEERPSNLRAIEGVSTSTAGFVGPAERGPVAGLSLPFKPDNGFILESDPTPVLVTSYAQFVRHFGKPLELPVATDNEDRGYLGHAVRAAFANGLKRVYIARITASNTDDKVISNSIRLHQGTVLRLLRPAKKGDAMLSLNSLRGISIGSSLTFKRRSDGTDALLKPATHATLTGNKVAPFKLENNDTLTIEVTGINPPTSDTMDSITATPAEITTSSEPFAISVTDTLEIKSGGPSSAIQKARFDTVNDSLATAEEVKAVLDRDITGIEVEVDQDKLIIRSKVSGTDGYLEVVGGSAASILNISVVTGSGNVANIDAVTVSEIRSLFTPPIHFDLTTSNEGNLVVITHEAGDGVSISATGPAAIGLGLNAATHIIGQGGGSTPTSIGVESYDTQNRSIRLVKNLPDDLDPSETYIEVDSANILDKGPKFHARNPGTWSESVYVNIIPSERAPVEITNPAPAGQNSNSIQVASATSFYKGAIIEIDHDGQQRNAYEVTDINGRTLTINPGLEAAVGSIPKTIPYARVLEIDVSIIDTSGAAPDEMYRGLTWNPLEIESARVRHYATQINKRSRLVYVQPPGVGGIGGDESGLLDSQPITVNGFPVPLFDESNKAVADFPSSGTIGDAAYVGEDNGPGKRTGIQSLADIPSISIVAAPGRTTATVQLALIAHCELMQYRIAVLDGEQNVDSVNKIQSHRNRYDTSYAAYYAPWIGQNIAGEVRYLPPSGYMAGIYANVDSQRGVGKPPANEVVRNAFSLRTNYTTGEQEILNPNGVNLIRYFEPGGIRVWGARTLSSNPEVKYVNVRRVLNFLKASINYNTQWIVFEPNTPETWLRVTASVHSFLSTQWREGLLFGRNEDDSFFVRCDESTMTADDVLNGRLICEIGVAIVRPAEFVIFRIEQITGFAES